MITPGQLVAVMGPSGCGKSTFAKLLQGFYQPTSGAIQIDGADIRYLSANELRSYFGVVPQETTLFSGSILENFGSRIRSPRLSRSLPRAKWQRSMRSIEALPNGYQTEIGERGAGLSGGQRQRLSIARAVLKGPKILIFDEATSSVDLPRRSNWDERSTHSRAKRRSSSLHMRCPGRCSRIRSFALARN